MNIEALKQIWRDWESSDDSSAVTSEEGNKFVWAFGVLFAKKSCHTRLGEGEILQLKQAYLTGKITFENETLERQRQAALKPQAQAA